MNKLKLYIRNNYSKIRKKLIGEGYANKLYKFNYFGIDYVLRESETAIASVYNYKRLFEKYFGQNIIVINDNLICYKFINGIDVSQKLDNILLCDEIDLFKKIGKLYSGLHAIRYFCYIYKGLVFDTWIDLFSFKLDEISNKYNRHYITKFKAILSMEFKNYVPPKRLLHGDFSVKNIIFNAGNLYLIDWDRFMVGDPLFEIANFFSRTYNRSRGDFEYNLIITSFLNGYCNNKSILKMFGNRISVFLVYDIYFNIEQLNHAIKKKSVMISLYKRRIEYLLELFNNMN